ncbi:MAG: hypothetical protein GX759_01175 [Thermoanaerobacterales bacterium]|nr:hypothetical protein [Thermoanaerobacterales bacterium]
MASFKPVINLFQVICAHIAMMSAIKMLPEYRSEAKVIKPNTVWLKAPATPEKRATEPRLVKKSNKASIAPNVKCAMKIEPPKNNTIPVFKVSSMTGATNTIAFKPVSFKALVLIKYETTAAIRAEISADNAVPKG